MTDEKKQEMADLRAQAIEDEIRMQEEEMYNLFPIMDEATATDELYNRG